MSELTRCNWHVLEGIKRAHPDALIKITAEDGWLRVTVDGEQRVSFLALTTRCVC